MATTIDEPDGDVTRRDFIYIAATAFGAIGAAAAIWPLIDQMNPDASALSLASVDIDLAPIQKGQAVTVLWRGKPIFIRNRTADEVAKAKAATVADLKDPKRRGYGRAVSAARDRREPHQAWEGKLAGHDRHLHASRVHPEGAVAGR